MIKILKMAQVATPVLWQSYFTFRQELCALTNDVFFYKNREELINAIDKDRKSVEYVAFIYDEMYGRIKHSVETNDFFIIFKESITYSGIEQILKELMRLFSTLLPFSITTGNRKLQALLANEGYSADTDIIFSLQRTHIRSDYLQAALRKDMQEYTIHYIDNARESKDFRQVLNFLQKTDLPGTWNQNEFSDFLAELADANKYFRFISLERGKEIAGLSYVYNLAGANDVFYQGLTIVLPDERHRGLAMYMKAAILQKLLGISNFTEVRTITDSHNQAMLKLNENFGFVAERRLMIFLINPASRGNLCLA